MNRYKTPLRYPGGKQKLAPFVAEVIRENGLAGGHYVEPYAGGAGVAMELLLDGVVSHVHLNDSCSAVYSFWRAVLTDTEAFCRRITRAPLTVQEWRRQQAILHDQHDHDPLERLHRRTRNGQQYPGLVGL